MVAMHKSDVGTLRHSLALQAGSTRRFPEADQRTGRRDRLEHLQSTLK
jgi:hypothetical protein